MFRGIVAAVCLFAMPLATITPILNAADHRDAPGVDGAGEGDITDVFAFLDPANNGNLVLAMGVNPFAVPGATSSYRFSPDYLYQFKIDRYGTYKEDFVIQVQFQNTTSGQQATVNVGTPDPNTIGAVNQPLVNPGSSISGPVGQVFGDPNSIQAFTGLRDDPFVRVRRDGRSVVLALRDPRGDQRLNYTFPLVDHARGEL
jgi:hypothetical protein